MRTLSSEDAFFLYLETPDQHQHVISTMILDPATALESGGPVIEQLIEKFRGDIKSMPEFSQKLVKTPLALTPPVLVNDPEFVFRNHIHRIAVPAPGGLRQLAMLVEDIASTPLSHRRPLWECWFVSGLEEGRVAVVLKTHHCLADGVTGIKAMSRLFDATPVPRTPEPQGLPRERKLASWELTAKALQTQWRYRPRYLDVMGRTARSLRKRHQLFTESSELEGLVPALFEEAPKLKFNAPITANRTVAFGSLPLAEIKRVKQALGCTVNDVVVSACTLALRHYLIAIDDLPDQPLICCQPVSLALKGEESAKPEQGNQVGTMSVRLPVHLTEPAEMVQAVCRSTRAAKDVFEQSFENLLQRYVGIMPPAVADWALKATLDKKMVARGPTSANLVISNLPGPPVPLYMNGAQMTSSFGMGPIISGQGPNLTFVSYADSMNFSVQACREQVADIWLLAEGIEAAFEEIRALASARDARPPADSQSARPSASPKQQAAAASVREASSAQV